MTIYQFAPKRENNNKKVEKQLFSPINENKLKVNCKESQNAMGEDQVEVEFLQRGLLEVKYSTV